MAYDNLKLEKGLYTTGKSFTQALEQIDPSENYAGTRWRGWTPISVSLSALTLKSVASAPTRCPNSSRPRTLRRCSRSM